MTNYVEIAISKDGGHTWSDWQVRDMGSTGQFAKRLTWRRLGTARQFLVKIRCSANCKRDIIAASAQLEGLGQ